jgi:dienelactone hydrolase
MKQLIKCILILLCVFPLQGCSDKEMEPGNSQTLSVDNIENSKEDMQSQEDSTLQQSTEEPESYGPVTGDNLLVAQEFASDLLEENFTKLSQAYQYDEVMKAEITADDTIKTILFYNAEYGKFEKYNEAYAYSIGAYQYVIIPVECSLNNFNLQIAFDGNGNITGFNYSEYLTRTTADMGTIPEGVIETEYTFTSDGYVIPGTFTEPETGSDFPVVILVQGFGSSDRDESIYENKPFRDIAWALAKEGIASYRYDKRNYLYEVQMKNDTSLTIKDETTDDIIAAAGMVKNLEDTDPARIFILGHSLGGYVLPGIDKELSEISGYIMMSAPAQHMKKYIYEEYDYLAGEDETVTKEEQRQLNALKNQLKQLEEPEIIPDKETIFGAYRDYWVDLDSYYPVKLAKKIKKPVLVLQGERDYQVTMKQFNIWKKNFEKSENWTFISYPSLNHFMMAGYGNPTSGEYKVRSHVDHKVTQDIIQFIMGTNQ